MRNGFVLVGLVSSGAAGLIQQIVWIRALTLVVGSTTEAVSTVVAVFFLGLAVGSELFGRVAPRVARPLRLLAGVELVVALFAAAVLPALAWLDPWFGELYRRFDGDGSLLVAGRALLVSLLLLPPTIAMGGVLPLVTRRVVTGDDRLISGVGGAYSANTLGAAFGCALAGFFLLPRFGLIPSVAVGVGASLVSAAAFALLSRRAPVEARGVAPAGSPAPWVLVWVVGLAGGVALGGEVLWTRFLTFVVRHSLESYTLALTIVLVGIVLGSAAVARWPVTASRRVPLLGGLLVAQGLAFWVSLNLPPAAWLAVGGRLPTLAALLLPSAIVSGAIFPLAVGSIASRAGVAAPRVGRLLAANTLGGIVGSLAVGYWALPRLGMDGTAAGLTAMACAAAAMVWWRLDRSRASWQARRAAASVAVVAIVLGALLPNARLPEDWLARGGTLVAHRETRAATLAVLRNGGTLDLEIDGWWQGSNRWTHQAVAAHVPMLLHPDPRRILVVGAGAGQTPRRFLLHDIDALDCVDIEPAVFDLIREHFDGGWMSDPRVRLIRGDGRSHVLHASPRYDVISLELGQAFRPGVASFYTVDFYRRARQRLRAEGILMQFVPLPFLTPSLLRSVVASFVEAFPRSFLWYNTSELLLVGSVGSEPLGAALRDRLAHARVKADLDHRFWGGPGNELDHPEVFLAGALAGPRELKALAEGATTLRDGDVRLEAETGRVAESTTREVTLLPLLRGALAAPGAGLAVPLTPEERRRVLHVRAGNLGAIEAEAWVRSVAFLDPTDDASEVGRRLELARAANPEHGETRRLLGDLRLLEGRPQEALEHHREAVRADPDGVLARTGLAMSLLALNRPGEAAHQLRQVVALAPERTEAHNQLGVALARQGHRAPAARAFERALALDAGHADARRNLARLRRLDAGPPTGFHSGSP